MDDDGEGLVSVLVGWVGFEWRGRESFVPGRIDERHASRQGAGDSVQRARVAGISRGAADDRFHERRADARPRSRACWTEAEERDEVTLWHLLTRVNGATAIACSIAWRSLCRRRQRVTRDGIRAGRRDMLDAWWDALGLGTAAWWRTWKGSPVEK